MSSIKNLQGDILIRDFRISYGVINLSTDESQVVISYKGWADPILTADITTYDYSMDNGTTWNQMTPSEDTVLTAKNFTSTGATFIFKWEAATDIGMDRYNNTIRIRLGATSGASITDNSQYVLFFERLQTNLAAATQGIPFPLDYSGIPPSDLMKNAPKS